MRTQTATGFRRLAGIGASFFLALLIVLTGCESEPEDQPPADWETDGDRWWHTDLDTTNVFRDVDSLQVMLADYEVPAAAAEDEPMTSEQFAHGVRTELEPMYRHNPEVVDSLFRQFAMADIEEGSDFEQQQLDEYRVDTYETLREHFREPEAVTRVGDDVQIIYPDTLAGNPEGRISMQVYLNDEGVPRALKLNESVNPTLDRIAMRAGTEMRWEPAYILRDGEWEGIPSWTEFNVRISAPR